MAAGRWSFNLLHRTAGQREGDEAKRAKRAEVRTKRQEEVRKQMEEEQSAAAAEQGGSDEEKK